MQGYADKTSKQTSDERRAGTKKTGTGPGFRFLVSGGRIAFTASPFSYVGPDCVGLGVHCSYSHSASPPQVTYAAIPKDLTMGSNEIQYATGHKGTTPPDHERTGNATQQGAFRCRLFSQHKHS